MAAAPQPIPAQPGQPMVAASTVPIPDPTLLTTQALREAIANQKEFFTAQIENQQRALDQVQALVFEKIDRLAETATERFKGIERQFDASKEAVASALAAAKEAVGKTEVSTTKQIDSMKELIDTKGDSTDATIAALKERIDRQDGRSGGINDSWGLIIALGGLLIGAGGIAVAFLH